ncbi:hypothetical protein A2U01_0068086, partial [Trifolium medium]|nr:hypothetical protein [Trifolium medium]
MIADAEEKGLITPGQ